MLNFLYLFYFLSGATALIYEIVWARRLGLIFGVDAYGIATVLTVFFIGLALGSWLFGKYVEKSKTPPLKLYAFWELSIGIYAALTPLIFKYLTNLQLFLFDSLGNPQLFSFSLIVFLLSILVLIVPTTLMGATFPAAVKAASLISADIGANPRRADEHGTAGLLYGFNTLGAVIGTILAGFLLVWLLGSNLTTYLTALLNLSIGFAVIYISRKLIKTDIGANRLRADQRSSAIIRAHQRILFAVFFLTGFAALALEVLWTRVLVITFGASIYAFATVLATFLLGIAAGSLIAARFIKKNLELIFTLSLTALGILVVLLTLILGNLPTFILGFFQPQNPSFWQNITASVIASSLIILLPTLLMGVTFVVGLKIYLAGSGKIAKDVGTLYAINTVGGVLGAFVAGFLIFPTIGAQRGIATAALIYVASATLVAFRISHQKYLRYGTVITAIVVLVLGLLLPSWNKHILSSGVAVYYQDLLQRPKTEFAKAVSEGEILFYKEGVLATVMVKKAPEGFLFLRSNGKTDASTEQDLDDFRLLGHLPLILHPNPQKTLLVGIGSGISAGAMAAHKPKGLEVVEIEQAMVEAARHFGQYNHNVLDNPNVQIVQADARAYLTKNQNHYDVIASQPSNPWVRGNANLFTREFFQIAKDALASDGLMMQWVQFYSFANEDFRSVLKTFAEVFPYVSAWTPVASHDILLLGSKMPQQFDFAKVNEMVKSPSLQEDLAAAAITSGESLLAHYLFDQSQLKNLAGDARVITDDKPKIEFSAPFSLNRQTLVANLTTLLAFQGNYQDHFENLDQADTNQIDKAKEAVSLILRAKIKAQSGQLLEATADFEKAIAVLPKELTKKELARIYFELARQASEVNDVAKMTAYFEKSVASHPNADVYLNLAIVYLSQNRIAKATESLEAAKNLQPDNPRIVEVEKAINDRRYSR